MLEDVSIPEEGHITVDDLIGAWESFQGDGLHGWTYHVLVFCRDRDRIVLQTWMPQKKGDSIGKLSLQATKGTNCMPIGNGLLLRVEGWMTIELQPVEGGRLRRTMPGTTAGAVYFRRIVLP